MEKKALLEKREATFLDVIDDPTTFHQNIATQGLSRSKKNNIGPRLLVAPFIATIYPCGARHPLMACLTRILQNRYHLCFCSECNTSKDFVFKTTLSKILFLTLN